MSMDLIFISTIYRVCAAITDNFIALPLQSVAGTAGAINPVVSITFSSGVAGSRTPVGHSLVAFTKALRFNHKLGMSRTAADPFRG